MDAARSSFSPATSSIGMCGTASAGSNGSLLMASTRDSSEKMLLLGSIWAIFSSPAVDASAIGVPSAR